MSKEIKKKNVETAIDGVEVNEAFDGFVPNSKEKPKKTKTK